MSLILEGQLTHVQPTAKGAFISTVFDGRDMFKVYSKAPLNTAIGEKLKLSVQPMTGKDGRAPLFGLQG